VDGSAVDQAVDVGCLAAVAAEQVVLAQVPQIAGLGLWLVGRLRYCIRVGLAFGGSRFEQA
jgi:hypothetical protein